jgi:hypothetical protein
VTAVSLGGAPSNRPRRQARQTDQIAKAQPSLTVTHPRRPVRGRPPPTPRGPASLPAPPAAASCRGFRPRPPAQPSSTGPPAVRRTRRAGVLPATLRPQPPPVPLTGSRSHAWRLPRRSLGPTTAGPPAARQEASAAAICAATGAAWALKAMPGTVVGAGPPVRRADRHDADGRGPPAGPSAGGTSCSSTTWAMTRAVCGDPRGLWCRTSVSSFPIHWGGPAVGKDPADFVGW